MKVQVTSQLRAQLAQVNSAAGQALVNSTAEKVLVDNFIAWKSRAESVPHHWFARDVRGDDGNLWHVHLVPTIGTDDRQQWDTFFYGPPKRPWDRTSDRYLLYADAGIRGYLLIAIIEDPGAHLIWTPAYRQIREQFEIVAENFVVFNVVP